MCEGRPGGAVWPREDRDAGTQWENGDARLPERVCNGLWDAFDTVDEIEEPLPEPGDFPGTRYNEHPWDDVEGIWR